MDEATEKILLEFSRDWYMYISHKYRGETRMRLLETAVYIQKHINNRVKEMNSE